MLVMSPVRPDERITLDVDTLTHVIRSVGTERYDKACFELFERQDRTYRKEVLGSVLRVAIEAGSPFGWTRYVRHESDVVGMRSFGASGPAEALYQHFGITAERVVEVVRKRL